MPKRFWKSFKWKESIRRARLPSISVMMAIIAWFLVHSSQTVKEDHLVPVTYKNLSPDLAFSRQPIENVRMGFVGVFHRLRSAELERLTYEVDLSEAKAGLTSVEVNVGQLFLPVDIDVVNPRPRRIDVFLETKQSKEVPVKINLQGSLKSGLVVSKLKATPNPVVITGPLSALNKIDRITVDLPVRDRVES